MLVAQLVGEGAAVLFIYSEMKRKEAEDNLPQFCHQGRVVQPLTEMSWTIDPGLLHVECTPKLGQDRHLPGTLASGVHWLWITPT